MPRTIVIAAAALLAAVTPAATWEAPVRLSAPSVVLDGPRLATDAAGNALLVWAPGRPVPGQSGEVPGESWVEASYRAAGDSGWGPVARVSPPGQPAYFPVAGLLPGGRALVMWSALQSTVLSRESVRDANGAWGADAPAATSVPYAQQWAVGPDGTAAVAWVTGPAPDPGRDGGRACTERHLGCTGLAGDGVPGAGGGGRRAGRGGQCRARPPR